MKKLASSFPNMFLSLLGVCAISGLIVTGANIYTSGPIARSKAAALEEALRKVIPAFDNNPLQEMYRAGIAEGDSLSIYPATKDGQPVGAAVESITRKGFSGEIKILVGFDAEGRLVDYSVLQHAETPGLGSKMDAWFRTDKNQQSVIGRSLAQGALSLAKDGGDVDGITASTITSRAFLDALNRAYSAYAGANIDSQTGASKINKTNNE
ncbi:MAG: RnfABCDGE type electron transport complex subunit G [Tannerellaceae bacterium]|jgi:electron transport complex protein RnfG|nr:RnfABCDGE type electron transport complex subunit G [Tannerellaceae bacterium]